MALTELSPISEAYFCSATATFIKRWENPGLVGAPTPPKDGAIHNESRVVAEFHGSITNDMFLV